MRKCFFADRIALVEGGTLLTVTGTCYEGGGKITSQINGRTVMTEVIEVKTEDEFNDNADNALERLERCAASPIRESDLARCEITGRVQ